MTRADLRPYLYDRLRREPTRYSVPGSLPVLFFGDAFTARIATIGLNPSKSEYLDRHGTILVGQQQRFATVSSLGASSRGELTDAQADQSIDVMRCYFDEGKPVYGSYFRHLANFLRGAGTSYRDRSAAHLDLVQESTDPVWGNLTASERQGLLEQDLPFLVWQLENLPRLQVVVCAGRTVSDQIRARVCVEPTDAGSMMRLRWWRGTARVGQRDLVIAGWNYPLDRPTGLDTNGEIELGKLLGRGIG